MTETKEFHELFSQGSGRIFALLISTDGRGHYDNRGRLSLDYCEAGQTFDLPNGMFDSDKYRNSDVVLTFAKLEHGDQHKGEYLLVDVHSVKAPVIKAGASEKTAAKNTPTTRSGTITFAGQEIPTQQFYTEQQLKITLMLTGQNAYPQLLDFTDLYYNGCTVNNDAVAPYNDTELRRGLFDHWFAKQGKPAHHPTKLGELKDSYYIVTKSRDVQSIATLLGRSYNSIYEVADARQLQTLKDDWKDAKKVYFNNPTSKEERDNPQETSGAASTALQFYIDFLNQDTIPVEENLIYFGAPGTGKSYTLNKELEQFDGRYERVTFYSDYLHAQFVGSFRPQAITTADGTADFTYAFTPGPFTRVLIDALKDPDNEHVLVIEEINRADPAAVFGDIFQLLDRDGSGISTYPVTVSEDMKSYLWKELGPAGREQLLKTTRQTGITTEDSAPTSLSIAIPSNMLIWATMNSADQGVYPMDTAFKRRWSFRYIDIDAGADEITDSAWKQWRTIINKLLLTKVGVSEDKLLGPFFLGDPKLAVGTPEFDDAFKNKVIMYLFEDAARYERNKVFNAARISSGNASDIKGLTLQSLFSAWDKIRFDIFNKSNE